MGCWGRGRGESYWPPYVPVAERRARAAAQLAKLRKKGERLEPVVVEGSGIARTFWGKAWCDNLLRYSDFANRMPRGRSYLRNGHVLDLRIEPGKVTARVAGTSLYAVEIGIRPVAKPRWRTICGECSGRIDSLVSLLQGKLSPAVMEVITRPGRGMFPEPAEIELSCSCPDWAAMCKHVAAALYGVGARLDERPGLLFLLRGVNQGELLGAATKATKARPARTERVLEGADLSGLFGIEVEQGASVEGGAGKPAGAARGRSARAKEGRWRSGATTASPAMTAAKPALASARASGGRMRGGVGRWSLPGDGYAMAPCGPDCNDTRREDYPTAADPCDGRDNNCDGRTDEDFVMGANCDGTDEDLCAPARRWDARGLPGWSATTIPPATSSHATTGWTTTATAWRTRTCGVPGATSEQTCPSTTCGSTAPTTSVSPPATRLRRTTPSSRDGTRRLPCGGDAR